MAVPKHKASKMQTASRYANWKTKNPSISECPQCHEYKQNHRVCPSCGYYDGVQRVDKSKDSE